MARMKYRRRKPRRKRYILRRFWDAAEDSILRQSYKKFPHKVIAARLGRTVPSISKRLGTLGIRDKGAPLKYWTKEEIAFVRKHYRSMQVKQIAARLGRSVGTIEFMAKKLNVRKYHVRILRDDERALFRTLYQREGAAAAVKALGLTINQARSHAHGMNIHTPNPLVYWTAEERAYLVANYGKMPTPAIAKHLGKPLNSCHVFARRFGVAGERAPFWTAREEELLRRDYRKMTWRQLGDLLGRTYKAVQTRAARLGLTRKGASRNSAPRKAGRRAGLRRNVRAALAPPQPKN